MNIRVNIDSRAHINCPTALKDTLNFGDNFSLECSIWRRSWKLFLSRWEIINCKNGMRTTDPGTDKFYGWQPLSKNRSWRHCENDKKSWSPSKRFSPTPLFSGVILLNPNVIWTELTTLYALPRISTTVRSFIAEKFTVDALRYWPLTLTSFIHRVLPWPVTVLRFFQ